MNFFFLQFAIPVKIVDLCDYCRNQPKIIYSRYCSETCENAHKIRLAVITLTTCKKCARPIHDRRDYCSDQCRQAYHINRVCINCHINLITPIYFPYCGFDCRNMSANQFNYLNHNNQSHW